MLFFFLSFIKFIGVTLIKLQRFQVYNSIIHHLCIMQYVFTTQSRVSLSSSIWPSFSCDLSPPSFPLVATTLLSVSMSFCLFVAFSFVSYIWVKWYGFWPFLTHFTEHDTLKIHPYCHKRQYFILWLSSIPLYIWTAFSLSNHLPKDTLVVSTSWPPWIMLQWTQSCLYLCKQMISNLGLDTQKRGSQGHLETLFLIFWETSMPVSIVAVPVYIPTSSV